MEGKGRTCAISPPVSPPPPPLCKRHQILKVIRPLRRLRPRQERATNAHLSGRTIAMTGRPRSRNGALARPLCGPQSGAIPSSVGPHRPNVSTPDGGYASAVGVQPSLAVIGQPAGPLHEGIPMPSKTPRAQARDRTVRGGLHGIARGAATPRCRKRSAAPLQTAVAPREGRVDVRCGTAVRVKARRWGHPHRARRKWLPRGGWRGGQPAPLLRIPPAIVRLIIYDRSPGRA